MFFFLKILFMTSEIFPYMGMRTLALIFCGRIGTLDYNNFYGSFLCY